jgi:gamma-glutamylcyclotransferase (GGCT)/AIG2-like uncharacterized protein YtfP
MGAMKPRLFVYGTLRRSHPELHRKLVGPARLLGAGTISGRLYDLGEYPGIHRSRAHASRVHGELYELDDPEPERRLSKLDRYEGAEFSRQRVLVELQDGRRHLAWAYMLAHAPSSAARPIRSGSYRRKAARRVA